MDELNPFLDVEETPETLTMQQEPEETPELAYSAKGPIILQLEESEQMEVVTLCNSLKTQLTQNATIKKQRMLKSYNYLHNKMEDNDLLPIADPMNNSCNEENITRPDSSYRPRIFIPLTRQQYKQLYSQLKQTIFPNDESYFRIRAKSDEMSPEGLPYTEYEEPLTEAVKYLFKEHKISEKAGNFLGDLIWSGTGVAQPTIKQCKEWTWQIDPATRQAYPAISSERQEIDLKVWNPLAFFPDPYEDDPKNAKWAYCETLKLQQVKDYYAMMNGEKLDSLGRNMVNEGHDTNQNATMSLGTANGLGSSFNDIEKSITVDTYYFPFLKTRDHEYRNVIFKIAGGMVLIDARPNLLPNNGMPAIYTDWMPDKNSGYSMGPLEDIQNHQKLINILYNYSIETLARIGNRFAVAEGTDLTQLFGIAGGVLWTKGPPGNAVMPLTGNYQEIGETLNFAGVLKAEATQLAGSQNPFQGGSNIDFKKTATEMQILQENSYSVNREIIDHLVYTGIQPILEQLMYLAASINNEPITIRVDSPREGVSYQTVDLSLLNSGKFTLEVVSVNPSQSKQAQVQGLTQFMEFAASNPQALYSMEPIAKRLGTLWGIKDTDNMLSEILDRVGITQQLAEFQQFKQQQEQLAMEQQALEQGQQGIPGPEAGLPAY